MTRGQFIYDIIQQQKHVAGFCQYLQAQGWGIAIEQQILAEHVLSLASPRDLPYIRRLLKPLFCRRIETWENFDTLFYTFWLNLERQQTRSPDEAMPRAANSGGLLVGLSSSVSNELDTDVQQSSGGAGMHAALTQTDFRFLTDRKQWEQVAKAAEALARNIRKRPQRKWRYGTSGNRVALKQSLKYMAAYGGDPLRLVYKKRKSKPLELVILLDVSHSMGYYSPMLARFALALAKSYLKPEIFAFHVRLFRLTSWFRLLDSWRLQKKLESMAQIWYGGTCIGESIQTFNTQNAHKLCSNNTVLLIFSDGYDTMNAEALRAPLATLKARVRRLYWVNPMCKKANQGEENSESTLGQVGDLVDGQFPGSNLAALSQLAEVLSRA